MSSMNWVLCLVWQRRQREVNHDMKSMVLCIRIQSWETPILTLISSKTTQRRITTLERWPEQRPMLHQSIFTRRIKMKETNLSHLLTNTWEKISGRNSWRIVLRFFRINVGQAKRHLCWKNSYWYIVTLTLWWPNVPNMSIINLLINWLMLIYCSMLSNARNPA